MGWPVAGSHSRTVPSLPALASSRPSGENATLLTPPAWPSRVAAGWPVAGSHSRTVPSLPALASSRPSGENATLWTPPVWPSRVAAGWPVAGSHSRTVPSPPALASRPPVRGERHAVDPAGVAFQDAGEAGLGGRQAPLRRQVARREQGGQPSGVNGCGGVVRAAGKGGREVADRGMPGEQVAPLA